MRPQDFLVDEIPLFEPTGEGEHLYLRIRKTGLSHGDMVNGIAKAFGVSYKRIGYAGMKDKQAVTTQAVTVHTPRDADDLRLRAGIEVLWASRHAQKLHRGQLSGNRFSIVVREVDASCAASAGRVIRELEARGVPNFFGPQRFGFRRNNHLLGAFLIRREWPQLLDELLGTRGSPFPEHQRGAREAYERGDYREAHRRLPASSAVERAALRQLSQGHNSWRASLAGGRRALGFWVSATQSAIFNWVLDRRIESHLFETLHAGDLAWKHDSGAVFAVDDALAEAAETRSRVERLEISPSGPLWGPKMTPASGEVGEQEDAALRAMGLAPADLEDPPHRLHGQRRPMRVPIASAHVEGGSDDGAEFIRLSFELPRGAYATIVLREILKVDIDG